MTPQMNVGLVIFLKIDYEIKDAQLVPSGGFYQKTYRLTMATVLRIIEVVMSQAFGGYACNFHGVLRDSDLCL